MEGNLNKLGRGRNFAFIKPWSERYFILDSARKELSYFAQEKGVKRIRGTINVDRCVVAETRVETTGKLFSFEIRTKPNTEIEEIITLSAADDHTLIAWLNALSLSGLNEVHWLPCRFPLCEKIKLPPSTDSGAGDDLCDAVEGAVEGELFKKVYVSTPCSPGGGSLWVKRIFSLDPSQRVLSLHTCGAKRTLDAALSLSFGSVQEVLQANSGKPYSFTLRCRGGGGSLAARDEVTELALPDLTQKQRLLGALCRVLGCEVTPPPAVNSSAIVSTLAAASLAPTAGPEEAAPGQLTKQQVVERERAARLKAQAEKIDHLRLVEDMRKQNECNSLMNGTLEKIQNRIHQDIAFAPGRSQHLSRPTNSMLPAECALQRSGAHTYTDCIMSEGDAYSPRAGRVVHAPLKGKAIVDYRRHLSIDVIKVLTPAKNMKKFLYLKDLFPHSTSRVALDTIMEKLTEFEADYSLLDSGYSENDFEKPLHLLPAEGVMLEDVENYVNHCEQLQPTPSQEVSILVGASLAGCTTRVSCSLKSWAIETFDKLRHDTKLRGAISMSDSQLKKALHEKGEDVLFRTITLLSKDQAEIEKCHLFSGSSSTTRSLLIRQVVSNCKKRSLDKDVQLSSPRASEGRGCCRRDAPGAPRGEKPSQQKPVACAVKRFIPPPPRTPRSTAARADDGTAFANHQSQSTAASFSSEEYQHSHGGEDSPMHLSPSSPSTEATPMLANDSSFSSPSVPPHPSTHGNCDPAKNSGSPRSNEVTDTPLLHRQNNQPLPLHIDDDPDYTSLRLVVCKNKWWKKNIKSLANMKKMKIILARKGGCTSFLSSCCPRVHLQGVVEDRKLASDIGMSVSWLEAIAMRLGTFLPLSDRTFLVEAMYAKDPDGGRHVAWLSALLSSQGEEQEDLEE